MSVSRYSVFENTFCTYVKDEQTGKVHSIILKPDGAVVNTSHLNVIVHENGIEFLLDDASVTKLTN